MPKFLANLDLNQNELQNAVVQVLSSNPSSPTTGQIYYNSANNVLRYYNGTAWEDLAAGSGGETNQNAFSIVAVSGQSNVEADAKTDTLNFAAGNNVTITTNATTDTITIAASGDVDSVNGQTGAVTLDTPAIIDNSGTPALATGITAGEIRSLISVDSAGTDNSTNVSLVTTSHDYLSISGQAITLGAVSLADDVTGTLPIANGGTGATTASAARSALGVDPAGTDNSTDVTLNTTSYDYLSISGQQITLGQIDYSTDIANTPTIPAAANDATITISAGDGLQTGGNFTTNQSGDETITIDVDSTVVRTSGAQTIAGNKTFSNNVIVSGNLTVSGTTTSVDSTVVNIGDNIITLNSGETGTPSQDGGIEVERGTSDNAKWVWDEGNDRWTSYTTDGGDPETLTLADAQASTFHGALSGNASTATKLQTARTIQLNGDVTGSASFDGSANITITAAVADDSHNHTISNVDGLQTALDGKQATLTFGIANDNAVEIDDTDAASGDYAKFTANGLQGRNATEVKSDLSLNNVTNESKATMFTSAALTGTPTAPSASAATDTTQIATTAFTQDAIDARSYATSIGDGTNVSYTITHNLGTRDVIIQLYDSSSYDTVFADVVRTNTTQATITFASAPTTNDVRVLVTKVV
jgi:hypothetical protein